MPLPSLISTIHTHGLNAKKSLGQHFLLDENITAKVAARGGDLTGCTVIEIGPGPGGLTRALLAAGAKEVVAVEKDVRCIAALAELSDAYPNRLRVIGADAMGLCLPEITEGPRKIIANLPYNVGTLLLMQWLEEMGRSVAPQVGGASPEPALCDLQQANHGGNPIYQSLTLMFQREVAERIVAAPDTKEYGRVSVMAQWLCNVRHEFELPPSAFSPPPKVYSSVITLTPREAREPAEYSALQKVVAAGFGNRRKMLRQSLKTLGVSAEELLARAGIDGTRRAETLSIPEWCALARAFAA